MSFLELGHSSEVLPQSLWENCDAFSSRKPSLTPRLRIPKAPPPCHAVSQLTLSRLHMGSDQPLEGRTVNYAHAVLRHGG